MEEQRQKEADQRRAEELQNKQREEEQQLLREEEQRRNAKVLINIYVAQINKLPVTFPEATTIELIQNRKKALLNQLAAITEGKQDLETLSIGAEAPKITEAMAKKAEAINSTAQQLITKVEVQRAEQEKQRVEQERLLAEQAKQRAAEQEKQRAAEQEKQRAVEQEKQRAAEQEKQRAAEQEKQRAAEQAKQRAAEQEKQHVQNEKPAEKSIHHKAFDEAISVLIEKMKEFSDDPKYDSDPELQKAYKATKDLHTALEKEGNDFFTKEPSLESYQNFKFNCKRDVNDSRDVLNHHRGWGVIALNVFAMIITAGIGYAIAAGINIAVNKGKFTFFDTDSSKKLTAIEDYIENKANNAAPAA